MTNTIMVGVKILSHKEKYCNHCSRREEGCDFKLATEADKYCKSKSEDKEIEADFIWCYKPIE